MLAPVISSHFVQTIENTGQYEHIIMNANFECIDKNERDEERKKFAILTCEQDVNISQILAFISRDLNLIKCWSIIVQLLKFIR